MCFNDTICSTSIGSVCACMYEAETIIIIVVCYIVSLVFLLLLCLHVVCLLVYLERGSRGRHVSVVCPMYAVNVTTTNNLQHVMSSSIGYLSQLFLHLFPPPFTLPVYPSNLHILISFIPCNPYCTLPHSRLYCIHFYQ